MTTVKLNPSLPRHAAVGLAIREEIAQGVWRPGDKLPPIRLLAERYDVSIASIRRAIETLIEANVLIGVQGNGIFVRSFRKTGYWNRFHRYQRKDGTLITVYDDQLVSYELVQASAEIAAELGVKEGTWLIHWKSSMAFDGHFAGYDQAWLPRDVVPNLRPEHFLERPKDESVYALYEESDGLFITSSNDRIQAAVNGVDPLVSIPSEAGIPLLIIKRTSLDIRRRCVEFRMMMADARTVQIYTE